MNSNNLKIYNDSYNNNCELLTPTGASLLSYFTKNSKLKLKYFKNIPKKLINVGYGAGSLNLLTSNILRVSIYEIEEDKIISNSISCINKNIEKDNIEILETNIDNCNGEILGYLIKKLMNSGAKDASAIPIIMKKGRPGYTIKVITNAVNSYNLARILMLETGSLGVRVISTKHRIIAHRLFKNLTIK